LVYLQQLVAMSDLESVVKKLEKLAGKETVAPESVHRNGPMKLKA
jgi:hypothetical protein